MRLKRVLSIFAFVITAAISASAGQFKKAVYSPAGQRPYLVATAELTASGNVDLVVADYLTSQIFVLLGNGDGTFQKALSFSVPAPIAIAVGDLNGDGKQDLVLVESNGTGPGTLAVFLGQGNGKFVFKASYIVGDEAGYLALADFDGDGKLDVAETDAGNGSQGILRVLRGTGKGTLRKPTLYDIADIPAELAAGDLNGDGYPDLAVNQFGGGSVAVLLNDGTGHFQKPVIYSAGDCCGPVDVKIADLRNNGKQDLIIANDNAGMVVLLNKGDGTFGKPTIYTPFFQNWQPPEACTVADFNLDGNLDVACAASLNDGYLFYGDGKGKFGSGIEFKNALNHQGGFSIASGESITGNNAPDVAIPIEEYGKVAIMLNTK